MTETVVAKGKVYLVGAGPGDPGLLTIEASRLLQTADVVFHDDLVSPAILALIPDQVHVENVGKRCGHARVGQQQIHSLMINAAREGWTVVRLKAGDPLVFGRAGERDRSFARRRNRMPDRARNYGGLRSSGTRWNSLDRSSACFEALVLQQSPSRRKKR